MESDKFNDNKKMTEKEPQPLFTIQVDLPDTNFSEKKNTSTNFVDISFEFIAVSPKEIALLISSMAIENLRGGEMTGARKKFVQLVGRKISALRRAKGYSQQDLAYKLDYTNYKSVMNLEQTHKKTSEDTVENLSDLDKQLADYLKIAEVFNIPVDDLFEEAKKEISGLSFDPKTEKISYSPERFGRILKALRNIEGYSMDVFAQKLHCDCKAVCKIDCNNCKVACKVNCKLKRRVICKVNCKLDRKVDRRIIGLIENGKYDFNKIAGLQDKILAVFGLKFTDLFK